MYAIRSYYGHGSSPDAPPGGSYYQANACALEDLRRELGIERWHILGYSVGAWVAEAYIANYSDRVAKVVLLCPAVFSAPASAALRGFIQLDRRIPAFGSWILRGWRLHTLVRLLGFGGHDHPAARMSYNFV